MTNTTKLTQEQLLDDSDIESAIMGQQPKRTRKFVPSTPLNPTIFTAPKQNKPTSLLDLPEYYINSAVIDSSFTEAFKVPYQSGTRVPSHQQVRTAERNRNIGLILNKQYTPQKIISETELGTYAGIDEIITAPMEIKPIRPRIIKPEPEPVFIKPEKISRARVYSPEPFDIKKEFIEFREKMTPQDLIREEKIKTVYKYPLKQLKKKDTLLEHLSKIIEEEQE